MNPLWMECQHPRADPFAAEEVAGVIEEDFVEVDVRMIEGDLHRAGIPVFERARKERANDKSIC